MLWSGIAGALAVTASITAVLGEPPVAVPYDGRASAAEN
jgi:hypothetical protein